MPPIRKGARRVTVVSWPFTLTSNPYSPGGSPAKSTIPRVMPPPIPNGTSCAGVFTTVAVSPRTMRTLTAAVSGVCEYRSR